jgi:hypothetical protein
MTMAQKGRKKQMLNYREPNGFRMIAGNLYFYV